MKTIKFVTKNGGFIYGLPEHVPNVDEIVTLCSGVENKDAGDNTYIVTERKFVYSTDAGKLSTHIEVTLMPYNY